jgi:CDP-glucose 4,6-dehydratase
MGTRVTGPRDGGALPSPAFWEGRRVLLTGHTGFKGSWLTCWLRRLGAEVMGVSLPELPSQPSLWEQLALGEVVESRTDVAKDAWIEPAAAFDPEVVLHLAAQPLVSVGYAEPGSTFETNVLGTARVLEALGRFPSAAVCLVITTDKVYAPTTRGPYTEDDRLGGHDPYAASKAAAELVVASWPRTAAITATARAGNVIGGGDWAGDRLLPDLVRSWQAGEAVELRNPEGVRPWQHVLEPLRGYLVYAEALAADGTLPRVLNFGPAGRQAVTVAEVVDHAVGAWASLGGTVPSPPSRTAPGSHYRETSELTLESTRAAQVLGWASLLDWQAAVDMTLEWYAGERAARPAAELVSEQLSTYTAMIGGTP